MTNECKYFDMLTRKIDAEISIESEKMKMEQSDIRRAHATGRLFAYCDVKETIESIKYIMENTNE